MHSIYLDKQYLDKQLTGYSDLLKKRRVRSKNERVGVRRQIVRIV